MPALDGTGPNGQGPRTGRGLGNCPGQGGSLRNNRKAAGMGMGRGLRAAVRCPLCPLNQADEVVETKVKKEPKNNTKNPKE